MYLERCCREDVSVMTLVSLNQELFQQNCLNASENNVYDSERKFVMISPVILADRLSC